jgi:hypothetical protein
MEHKVFFHGTSEEGVKAIIQSGKLSVDYFGTKGIYLTDESYIASLFGDYIFWVTGIKERLLQTSDVNDGLFYPQEIILDEFITLRGCKLRLNTLKNLNRILLSCNRQPITKEEFYRNLRAVRFNNH